MTTWIITGAIVALFLFLGLFWKEILAALGNVIGFIGGRG